LFRWCFRAKLYQGMPNLVIRYAPVMPGRQFTFSTDAEERRIPPPTTVKLNSLLINLSPDDKLLNCTVPSGRPTLIDLISEYTTEEVLQRAIFMPMVGSTVGHGGILAVILRAVRNSLNGRLFVRLLPPSPCPMFPLTANVPSSIPSPSLTHLSSGPSLFSTRLAKSVKELAPGFSNLNPIFALLTTNASLQESFWTSPKPTIEYIQSSCSKTLG